MSTSAGYRQAALFQHRSYLHQWIEKSGDLQARAFAREAARQ